MTLRDDLAAVLGPGNDDATAYAQADAVLAVLAARIPTDRVVAKLAYPMPAGAMGKLVRGVEAVYGPGLLVDFAHPEAGEWMILTRPEEADA